MTPRAVEAGLSSDTHAEANADTMIKPKKNATENISPDLNLLRGKPSLPATFGIAMSFDTVVR